MSENIFLYIFLLAFASKAATESYQAQWEAMPGRMLYHLVFAEDGKILSTDTLTWPDGRSATLQYVKTEEALYRCIDYQDKYFRETGNQCYRLNKWPR